MQIISGGACLGVAQRHHAVYGYTEGIALHINVHADGLPSVGGQRTGIGCVFAVHMGLVLGSAVVGEQAVCNRAAVVEDIGNAVLVGIAVLVQLHLGGDGDIAGIALGDAQAIVNQSSLAAVRGAAHLEYLPHFGIGNKLGSAAAVGVSPAVQIIVQAGNIGKVDRSAHFDIRLGGGGFGHYGSDGRFVCQNGDFRGGSGLRSGGSFCKVCFRQGGLRFGKCAIGYFLGGGFRRGLYGFGRGVVLFCQNRNST